MPVTSQFLFGPFMRRGVTTEQRPWLVLLRDSKHRVHSESPRGRKQGLSAVLSTFSHLSLSGLYLDLLGKAVTPLFQSLCLQSFSLDPCVSRLLVH